MSTFFPAPATATIAELLPFVARRVRLVMVGRAVVRVSDAIFEFIRDEGAAARTAAAPFGIAIVFIVVL